MAPSSRVPSVWQRSPGCRSLKPLAAFHTWQQREWCVLMLSPNPVLSQFRIPGKEQPNPQRAGLLISINAIKRTPQSHDRRSLCWWFWILLYLQLILSITASYMQWRSHVVIPVHHSFVPGRHWVFIPALPICDKELGSESLLCLLLGSGPEARRASVSTSAYSNQ